MLFLFLSFILSEVTTELVQNDIYVQGDGTATQEILRKKGDYKKIENIIFEDGPSIIDSGFIEMSSLQTISFSKTIKQFQNKCFYRNFALKKFIVASDNPYIWTDGSFLYQNDNKTLVGTIISPSHFNILPTVETLHPRCFANVNYQKEIILPKTVKYLSENPFVQCSLSSVRFESGSSLEEMPSNSVNWCTITKFTIPPSVRIIRNQVFYQCKSSQIFFEDVENSNLTSIGVEAFSNCDCQNLILPSGVTELPERCFLSSELRSIRISASCSKISESAFSGCTKLSEVTVEEGNKYFKDVSGSLFSSDGKQLIFAPSQLEKFEIPAELESIAQSVVQGLVKVDKITITNGNKNFTAFEGCLQSASGSVLMGVCGGVKQLNVSAEITSIMSQACKGVGIISVKFLGGKCRTLGVEVFRGCKSLTEFCVPLGMESIGKYCFYDSGLTSLTYDSPSSLSTVSERAFQYLPLKILKLPKSVTVVGYASFGNLPNVEVFELESDSQLKTIYTLSFSYLKCTKPNHITLPTSLTSLSKSAFSSCQLEIRFESGCKITSLPEECFKNCKNIAGTFVVPSKVESIGTSAFSGCTNIEKIEFEEESALKIIMGSAFAQCSILKEMELPELTESFDSSAISGCFSLTKFTVSQKNNNFASEENILYVKNKTELIVCSPGVVNGYVSSTVESIRSNGFFQCTKLESVEFHSPSELKTISQNTFAGCTSLTTILLPKRVREIYERAFSDCKALESVSFGSGSELVKIWEGAFNGCWELRKVEFKGESLVEIGDSAFGDCQGMREINIPKSVRRVGKWCFKSSGLEEIEFGEIEEFGEGVFENCTELRRIEIDSALKLSESLFEGCVQLRAIRIPENVEVLGSKCLKGTGLDNVIVPSNVRRIESECFMNCVFLTEVNISSSSIEGVAVDCFIGCKAMERIIYCSTKAITGDFGLDPKKCAAYVSLNYASSQLCGLPARPQLQEGCLFVDPTASPTAMFTGPNGEPENILFVLTATVIKDTESLE